MVSLFNLFTVCHLRFFFLDCVLQFYRNCVVENIALFPILFNSIHVWLWSISEMSVDVSILVSSSLGISAEVLEHFFIIPVGVVV